MQHLLKRPDLGQDPGLGGVFVVVERVKGIEPSCAAWKAAVLPLNYTRIGPRSTGRPAMESRIAFLRSVSIRALLAHRFRKVVWISG